MGGVDRIKTQAVGTGSQSINHPAVQAADPLAVGIAAQLAPFNVPKGVAKKLVDNLHSQAFSARSSLTISIPTGNTMLFYCQNCVASNSDAASLIAFVCPAASLSPATSTIVSSTVGPNPTGVTINSLSTNTPYGVSTLAGADYTWRLVGSGIRVRNVSEQLYRGGILRYLMDSTGTVNGSIDAQVTTFSTIINLLNAAQHSIRKHFSDDSLVEILIPASNTGWASTSADTYDGVFAGANVPFSNGAPIDLYSGGGATRVGGTTSNLKGGCAPMVWGYFTNNSTGAQTIDIELVEHWEVHGSAISILHTPSPNHVQSQALIQNLVEHVATNHSNNPHLHFKDVVRDAVKLAHNKQACRDAGMAASIALAL